MPTNNTKFGHVSMVRMKNQSFTYEQIVEATKTGKSIGLINPQYYSDNNMPKLVYRQGNIERNIEVTLVSSQDDDEILLHKLFTKVKE